MHGLSGPASKWLLVAAGIVMLALSGCGEGSDGGEKDGATDGGPASIDGNETGPELQTTAVEDNPATPAIEPVRKDVRIIVEDEIALLPPDQKIIERLKPQQDAATKNAMEKARLPEKPKRFARPLIMGANDIRSGGVTIQLSGIEAPDASKTCVKGDGVPWPCGNFAKAALQRLVRARTLECEGDYTTEVLFEGKCRVGSTDLAEWLIERGWGKPAGGATSENFAAARAARRGMWAQ